MPAPSPPSAKGSEGFALQQQLHQQQQQQRDQQSQVFAQELHLHRLGRHGEAQQLWTHHFGGAVQTPGPGLCAWDQAMGQEEEQAAEYLKLQQGAQARQRHEQEVEQEVRRRL